MPPIKYPTGYPEKQREYATRYRRKQGQFEFGSPEHRAKVRASQIEAWQIRKTNRDRMFFSFPIIPEEDKWVESFIESTVDRITYQELYDA